MEPHNGPRLSRRFSSHGSTSCTDHPHLNQTYGCLLLSTESTNSHLPPIGSGSPANSSPFGLA